MDAETLERLEATPTTARRRIALARAEEASTFANIVRIETDAPSYWALPGLPYQLIDVLRASGDRADVARQVSDAWSAHERDDNVFRVCSSRRSTRY